MPRTGLWIRVFLALLLATLPPILMLAGALLLTETLFRDADPDLVAIGVVIGAIAWAAILAIVYTRSLSDDYQTLISLARSGKRGELESGSAYQQLASTLEERNRQVAVLAEQAAKIPIDREPRLAAGAVAAAVRHIMGDTTWHLAVHASSDEVVLPTGVYHAPDEPSPRSPIGEPERWAAVLGSDAHVRLAEGPWGAFVVVTVASTEQLRAVLMAPWEGRLPPSEAEKDLLALVGRNAGTALEHALLYSRVQTQADELNRLAAVQADFLRGVSHDLQTPLTSMRALATELRADTNVPPSARSDLDSIAHQADRLRRMVGQLLIASRLEAGVIKPRQEVFAVLPLVERTWSALRADRPFEIVVDGPAHLAVADGDRLEQVLWAVLDNAVKYSPADSPVRVRIAAVDGALDITITDRGSGMDAETQKRAFEQFYRAHDARTSAPDGSGVGLYAANGLMRAMGGSIRMRSSLGRGSSITLRIPAEPIEAAD